MLDLPHETVLVEAIDSVLGHVLVFVSISASLSLYPNSQVFAIAPVVCGDSSVTMLSHILAKQVKVFVPRSLLEVKAKVDGFQ